MKAYCLQDPTKYTTEVKSAGAVVGNGNLLHLLEGEHSLEKLPMWTS